MSETSTSISAERARAVEVLSDDEVGRLARLERVVEEHITGFRQAGVALAAIHDQRLYREKHGTFEAYLQERWGLSRRHGYRIIEAARVVENVSHGTQIEPPATERQARELVGLAPEEQRAAWVESVETAPGGRVTAEHVAETVQKRSGAPAALHSSDSNEWYTPEAYVHAAREWMGSIDLDPASCELANEVVRASKIYTIDDDGLAQTWRGRVWLNPPYGRNDESESNQGVWSARLAQQFDAGFASQAVLLVNAVTDRVWFAPLWERLICFVDHRIRFYAPDHGRSQPTHGSVLVGFGGDPDGFVRTFSKFGRCVVPRGTHSEAVG